LPEFHQIQLTQDERTWLSETCPFLTQQYLDYLQDYRFKPEQVDIQFTPASAADSEAQDPNAKGHIDITVTGLWEETILWEVPLMACLSETYFLTDDQDWNYDGQEGELSVYFRMSLYQLRVRIGLPEGQNFN
jgi:nicotinate phosphoribosyltransferase